MRRVGAVAVAVALALGSLTFDAPAAFATKAVPTHTVLERPFRQRGTVYLTVDAQHWRQRKPHWRASAGQYVALQVWRDGGWHNLPFGVNVLSSNNPAWAVGTLIIHRKHRHTYRAVTPATKVGTVYRAGSHSSPTTG